MAEPKILTYDIETAGVNALYADLGFVIVFGYKWLHEKKAHSLTFDKFGGYKKHGYSDAGLLKEASKLFDEADLVVAHYGDFFDKKFINGRLLINKLPPLPNTKSVDTVKVLWRIAKFSSNRLKNISNTLELRKKKSASKWPEWWYRVLAGDKKALMDMAGYCEDDVYATEEEYNRIRPFDEQHIRLFADRAVCALCGGKVQYRGTVLTGQNKYRRFQCLTEGCGKWDRERKPIKEVKDEVGKGRKRK